MRDTTIEGERPTPDIFFILPTGKGSDLRAPHQRDYSAEILAPVVKPWLEKDQDVSFASVQHVTATSRELRKMLESVEPIVAAEPPPPEPAIPVSKPPIELPPAARSLPAVPMPSLPPPVAPPPPAAVYAAPPPPPAPPPAQIPAPPPPSPPAYMAPETSGEVPILVPPQ